jgi:isopenicillin N synthase-like dioxygenase
LHSQKSKSKRFFNLPEHQKEDLTPTSQSFERGYFGIGKEKIRGQTCMKENFDFGNQQSSDLDSWPTEEQLPGFREFAGVFYKVRSALQTI